MSDQSPQSVGVPKFGDIVENGWASEDNPARRGFFVREFKRAGKLNPGRTWEITDGKGKFWEFKPSDIGDRLSVSAAPTPRHEAPADPCASHRSMGFHIDPCCPHCEAPAEVAGERVYIDCEFDGHNGPLLSVALVRESGDSIHIRADVEPMDLWVRQNVLPLMDSHKAARSEKVYAYEVGGVIRSFLGEGSPVIVCDSPQDARYFSQALTTAPDGGYAPFPFDGLTIEVLGVDAYPTTLEGAVQHNAWWDAMALREALRAHSSAP